MDSMPDDHDSLPTKPSNHPTGTPPLLNKKTGVEYWAAFPLDSVENIHRWQRDCIDSSVRRSSEHIGETMSSIHSSSPNGPSTSHQYSQPSLHTQSSWPGAAASFKFDHQDTSQGLPPANQSWNQQSLLGAAQQQQTAHNSYPGQLPTSSAAHNPSAPAFYPQGFQRQYFW